MSEIVSSEDESSRSEDGFFGTEDNCNLSRMAIAIEREQRNKSEQPIARISNP